MAAEGISSVKQRNPRGFMTVLSSAACEWFLILLLFLDAALSYLITKFASYYDLQTPCMLCSRFDQIFGERKTGCYRTCLCKNHKEEISFQVFCHVHGNLADVRAMCEECLVSFATDSLLYNESNSLMMTKLGNKSFVPTSLGPHACSCCKKTWRARSSAQRLLQLTSVGFGASKANVKPPLPRAPGRSRFSRRDSLKKIRDKISGPSSPRTTGVDHLSHVGYTELKVTSDSDSEIQISDDDDGYSSSRSKNYSKSENNNQNGKGVIQARQSSESGPSLLDLQMQVTSSSGNDVNSQASDVFGRHGLAELDWENLPSKASASALTLENVPQSQSIPEDHHVSGESSKPNAFLPHMDGLSVLSELISAKNIPSSSSINIQETDSAEINDEGNKSIEKNKEKVSVDLDGNTPSISNQRVRADISASGDSRIEVSDRLADPRAIISEAVKSGEDSADANVEGNNLNEKNNAKVPGDFDNSAPSISNQKIRADMSASDDRERREVSGRLAEPRSIISDAVKSGEDTSEANVEGSNLSEKNNAKALGDFDDSAPCISNQNIRADVLDRLAEPKALISDAVKSGEVSAEANVEGNNLNEMNNAKARGDFDDSAPSISNQKIQANVSAPVGSGREVSDKLTEPEEGMKSLPQLSTSGMEEPKAASPRHHGHPKSDASSSEQPHMPQTCTHSERDDSSSEQTDGFIISEIEGESTVDRLKRQVEHDQKCMNALYKELEEERSASAIATNQAMAMITRLQEEKAALHMEALQYLRMMEEQAEYDMEALERANELLSEREKELQDLEAELEFYRDNLPDELAAEDHSLDQVESKLSSRSDSKAIKTSKNSDKPKHFNDSICNFEDEKLRISQYLKDLEKKLFQVSGRHGLDNGQSGGYSEKIKKQSDNADLSKSNGGPIDKPADSDTGNRIKKVCFLGGEIDVASLENEISELNERLQALENDCSFLTHAFNSLQNGHDGIKFIQEIAHQLQDIRKIELKKR